MGFLQESRPGLWIPVFWAALGCSETPPLRFEVAFSRNVPIESIAWLETRVLQGGCIARASTLWSASEAFSESQEEDGLYQRETPLRLGRSRYGLEAEARDRNCRVVARGCVEFTRSRSSPIRLVLDPLDGAPRACSSNHCMNGQCRSATIDRLPWELTLEAALTEAIQRLELDIYRSGCTGSGESTWSMAMERGSTAFPRRLNGEA
ncbi:MAG: hypothetical protein NZM37_09735, partial [Sandaracinaceae bacterium]|nr:hypothetical protein [Sandaracinaceae bacterium]